MDCLRHFQTRAVTFLDSALYARRQSLVPSSTDVLHAVREAVQCLALVKLLVTERLSRGRRGTCASSSASLVCTSRTIPCLGPLRPSIRPLFLQPTALRAFMAVWRRQPHRFQPVRNPAKPVSILVLNNVDSVLLVLALVRLAPLLILPTTLRTPQLLITNGSGKSASCWWWCKGATQLPPSSSLLCNLALGDTSLHLRIFER
ncbi:hypothetical protein B0H12DRAFT_225112 [Mycena haematopus]|nr:hypothetical protein B0H12DRAFT_225112 [Mycena haematopus]